MGSASGHVALNPVNAGNYSFGDFMRMGLPLTGLVGLTSVVLVPLFLPF